MTETVILTCSSCFAKNRLPADKLQNDGRCGKCKHPVLSGQPIALNDATIFKFIQNNELPVVVDFWADWCGPCKSFAPHFEKAANDFKYRVRFAKLNTQTSQNSGAHFNIRSIPTLILFKGGKEVDRVSGALPPQDLARWINGH